MHPRLILSPALVIGLAACASSKPAESARPGAPQTTPESHLRLEDGCSGTVEHNTHTITCPGRYVLSRTIVESDDQWSETELIQMTLSTLRPGVETVGIISERRAEPELTDWTDNLGGALSPPRTTFLQLQPADTPKAL